MLNHFFDRLIKFCRSLPKGPRVDYIELAPAEHRKMDFSNPPPIGYFKNAVDSAIIDKSEYSWRGRVPDNSFRKEKILKDDMIGFIDVPLTRFSPRLGSFVLVPPLNSIEGINTGWGQLVRVSAVSSDKVIVSAYEKSGEVQKTIACSRVFALAVTHQVLSCNLRGRKNSIIPDPQKLIL